MQPGEQTEDDSVELDFKEHLQNSELPTWIADMYNSSEIYDFNTPPVQGNQDNGAENTLPF